jgi:uncharacterized protein YbjT (DUF2867 family)
LLFLAATGLNRSISARSLFSANDANMKKALRTIMTILVVGATGNTGRQIVQKLQQSGQTGLKVLARSRAKVQKTFGSTADLEIFEGDILKKESLAPALSGVQTVFCATGTRSGFGSNGAQQVDYEGTVNLIDQARQAGVEQFILVSSLCVSRILHPLNLFGGVLYWKKKAEEHLIRSGLPFTIVRPGGLRDGAGGAEIVMSPADTLFEGTIDRSDVARVCVEASQTNDAQDKIVEIVSGPGQSQTSLAAFFKQLPVARVRAAV